MFLSDSGAVDWVLYVVCCKLYASCTEQMHDFNRYLVGERKTIYKGIECSLLIQPHHHKTGQFASQIQQLQEYSSVRGSPALLKYKQLCGAIKYHFCDTKCNSHWTFRWEGGQGGEWLWRGPCSKASPESLCVVYN